MVERFIVRVLLRYVPPEEKRDEWTYVLILVSFGTSSFCKFQRCNLSAMPPPVQVSRLGEVGFSSAEGSCQLAGPGLYAVVAGIGKALTDVQCRTCRAGGFFSQVDSTLVRKGGQQQVLVAGGQCALAVPLALVSCRQPMDVGKYQENQPCGMG